MGGGTKIKSQSTAHESVLAAVRLCVDYQLGGGRRGYLIIVLVHSRATSGPPPSSARPSYYTDRPRANSWKRRRRGGQRPARNDCSCSLARQCNTSNKRPGVTHAYTRPTRRHPGGSGRAGRPAAAATAAQLVTTPPAFQTPDMTQDIHSAVISVP